LVNDFVAESNLTSSQETLPEAEQTDFSKYETAPDISQVLFTMLPFDALAIASASITALATFVSVASVLADDTLADFFDAQHALFAVADLEQL
jgi:hypothetical protein